MKKTILGCIAVTLILSACSFPIDKTFYNYSSYAVKYEVLELNGNLDSSTTILAGAQSMISVKKTQSPRIVSIDSSSDGKWVALNDTTSDCIMIFDIYPKGIPSGQYFHRFVNNSPSEVTITIVGGGILNSPLSIGSNNYAIALFSENTNSEYTPISSSGSKVSGVLSNIAGTTLLK